MLKLINKKYSYYLVLKRPQNLCRVSSNWRKLRPKFDVTDAKFEFDIPEDLDTLEDKEGTRL